MLGSKWIETFEDCTDNQLKEWDESLGKLPRFIFDEFVGLRGVHDILKNVIGRRAF